MAEDFYNLLGVARNATEAEIKAAYRALVKQHHPDAGGDEVQIVALNAAWEVLGEGERRRAYDSRTAPASAARQGSAPPAAEAASARAATRPPAPLRRSRR